MSESKEIATINTGLEAQIIAATQGREMLNKLFTTVLQQGVDFDRIPGTDKPTLLKPGGELLCQIFKLANGKPEMVFANEDFLNGLFSYTIGVPILSRETGEVVSYGIGAANSQEIKYKYRYMKQEGTEKEKMLNPEPADNQNTLIKMASKRAFIDGVLKATGASRMFTQDAEDMPWLKDEKASSKQIDYAKTLFKNSSNALVEISAIIGRTIEKWDDLTRSEASQAIESKKGKKPDIASSAKEPEKSGAVPPELEKRATGIYHKFIELGYSKEWYSQLCRDEWKAGKLTTSYGKKWTLEDVEHMEGLIPQYMATEKADLSEPSFMRNDVS